MVCQHRYTYCDTFESRLSPFLLDHFLLERCSPYHGNNKINYTQSSSTNLILGIVNFTVILNHWYRSWTVSSTNPVCVDSNLLIWSLTSRFPWPTIQVDVGECVLRRWSHSLSQKPLCPECKLSNVYIGLILSSVDISATSRMFHMLTKFSRHALYTSSLVIFFSLFCNYAHSRQRSRPSVFLSQGKKRG